MAPSMSKRLISDGMLVGAHVLSFCVFDLIMLHHFVSFGFNMWQKSEGEGGFVHLTV